MLDTVEPEEHFPFDMKGMRILQYDPKNNAVIQWYGQTMYLGFSSPIEDARYQALDLRVEWTPNEKSLDRSLWNDSTQFRRAITLPDKSAKFFAEAVKVYRDTVSLAVRERLESMLKRVALGYISLGNTSYITEHRGDLSLVACNVSDRLTDRNAQFVVGYHFEEDVFYIRYILSDTNGKGELKNFDGNDAYHELLSDMLQSLVVDMRQRKWG
jgi:hypothetical protein